VSAESGIPTFRDAQKGMWEDYDPMKLATPESFAGDPVRVTRWYDERRIKCAGCKPNPGHFALVRMEQALVDRGRTFTLLTQNVDGLHVRAGSRNIVELHGSLYRWRCSQCGREREEHGPAFGRYPPTCETCGGNRRPSVVWFGELLPSVAVLAAHRALAGCDVFLSLGTSAVVEPAASFLAATRRRRARTCEVNPEQTHVSHLVDWWIAGRTGEILPSLFAAAFG
jgi:NAD-dependent deacetylase